MNGRRYELCAVDGQLRRWTGWSPTLEDARARAKVKAKPGFPIEIRRGPGKGYGELVETINWFDEGNADER